VKDLWHIFEMGCLLPDLFLQRLTLDEAPKDDCSENAPNFIYILLTIYFLDVIDMGNSFHDIKTRWGLIIAVVPILVICMLPVAAGDMQQDEEGTSIEEKDEVNEESGADQSYGTSTDGSQDEDGVGTSDGNGSQYQWDNGNPYGNEDINKNTWRHGFREQIKHGVQNGTCIMECTLIKKEGQIVNNNYYYQNGSEVKLKEMNTNMIRVTISAEFQEGKVIVINVEDDVKKFENMDEIKVSFDENPIEPVTIKEVMKAEGSSSKYSAALDEGGTQFLVYIPHFSEHTIDIESVPGQSQEDSLTDSYIFIGLGILILIGLCAYMYSVGKGRV